MDPPDNQDYLDRQAHPAHQLILLHVTLRRAPSAHLDLLGCKEKRDKKVTKETLVFCVTATERLDYPGPRVRRGSKVLLEPSAQKETKAVPDFLDNLDDLDLRELRD